MIVELGPRHLIIYDWCSITNNALKTLQTFQTLQTVTNAFVFKGVVVWYKLKHTNQPRSLFETQTRRITIKSYKKTQILARLNSLDKVKNISSKVYIGVKIMCNRRIPGVPK